MQLKEWKEEIVIKNTYHGCWSGYLSAVAADGSAAAAKSPWLEEPGSCGLSEDLRGEDLLRTPREKGA